MAKKSSIYGGDILSEREQKNYKILELIRRRGVITKAEISQEADMNIVTVSSYVDYFIRKGLLVEKGLAVSSGGRKPALVELNSKAGFTIGIDLGSMDAQEVSMTGVVVDLAGANVYKLKKQRPKEDMESVLFHSIGFVKELIQSSKIEKKKLCGIGIGVHGIINEEAGTVRDNSRWGTRSNFLAIVDNLEKEYKLPIFIGNSASLAAFGENRLGGISEDVRNMLYFYFDVGCGIILDRDIYCGSTASAGALGVKVDVDKEEFHLYEGLSAFCPTGINLGLIDKAKKLLADGIDSRLSKLIEGDSAKLNLGLIIKAAEENDSIAKELIQNEAIHLGMRIAYLVNLFNPEVVVVGGGIEKAGSLFLDPLSRTVRRWAFDEAGARVDIVPAKLGEESVAKGAAGIVIREVFIHT